MISTVAIRSSRNHERRRPAVAGSRVRRRVLVRPCPPVPLHAMAGRRLKVADTNRHGRMDRGAMYHEMACAPLLRSQMRGPPAPPGPGRMHESGYKTGNVMSSNAVAAGWRLRAGAAAVAGAATLVLAGCGSSGGSAAPKAPDPVALARQLGCWKDNGAGSVPSVAAYDVAKAIDAMCPVPQPQLEIMTFSSAAKQTDWLHQNQTANTNEFGNGYTAVVNGHLWIVYPTDGVAGIQAVISQIGGKEVDF